MMKLFHITLFMISAALISNIEAVSDVPVGAYYGLDADNLPLPPEVVSLCRKNNIRRIRLYEADIDVLDALRDMGIDVSFGMSNSDIENMSKDSTLVEQWFNTYVKPYIGEVTINYIIVGDKAIDEYVLPVMKSLRTLLNANSLNAVKVTTLVGYNSILAVKDPPSAAVFDPSVVDYMKEILAFLVQTESPLMISLNPNQKYLYGKNISLNYAIFQGGDTVFDQGSLLTYFNLLDEMVDAFYAAIDKEEIDIHEVSIAIGEIGWPTCGNDAANPGLAQSFNQNMVNRIYSVLGTPKKPKVVIEAFIQSLFNENQKSQGESQCFGLFNVDSTPVYPMTF